MDNKKYYVYILLNPLKAGEYKYEELSFNFEPFYVGKGSGKRVEKHYDQRSGQNNQQKMDLISELIKAEQNPLFIKVYHTNDALEAYEYEKKLIFTIGRKSTGKGPLLNIQSSSVLKVNPKTKLYSEIKKTEKIVKKTFDIPTDLFESIMEYALRAKLYKFGPAVIELIRKGLEDKK